ncbi:Pyridoxal-dependent decarboxylase conserved domain containing protein, partial [Aphelenchoides avenae]
MLFERGRLSGAQFTEDDENHVRLLLKMSELYLFSNASFPEAFPACRKMEAEVIRMLCSLHHGGSKSCGVLTTSGSEAIVLACLAYRNWASKRGIRKPEIIVGSHAHVAFARAAKLLGLRIVHVAVNRNLQADLGAIKRAISRETCMIVASAPNFVTGIMDNVEGVASLGVRFGIPVHVDATIGGFLLPFMEQCDYPPPTFDFRLSGVASISVDLHKYAYCPVGASAVLYRDEELLHAQCYSNVHWPGGIYMSQTLGGSRPGSLIAYTWATLLYNGKLGYVEKTQKILDAASTVRSRLAELEHLTVLGAALGSDAERGCTMPVIAFTSTNPKIHIHALGDELNELGWNLNLLQNPNALRLCISLQQTKSEVIDEFLEDVKKCCEKILNNTEYTYATKTVNLLYRNVLFGLSTSFPDRGVAEHMAYMYADAYYSTPVMPHRSTRTLSIEGRKLSQINMG